MLSGRRLITTNITDLSTTESVKKALEAALGIHRKNQGEIERLFQIYHNDGTYWTKTKTQREDINNKITVDDAWAISRTINGYCFGEPIKYVSRKTGEKEGIQEKVELLSEMLDFQHNHDATVMATMSSSVCGLGYKLALAATQQEYDDTEVPFVINPEFIHPSNAFCVYSSDIMHRKVMGVLIGSSDSDIQYTVWTDDSKYTFKRNQNTNELVAEVEKNPIGRIPLVEVARNPFRCGDWEVVTDLFELKNKLISGRIDDIEQIIDYVLVLTNVAFADEAGKNEVLKSRVIELKQESPTNAPKVDILKNPLDQSGMQSLANYVDSVIESVTGVPSRAERGNGGHDTGQAVLYRNGFRDLENNASLIIPKMDKAETEFLGICISYSHKMVDDKLKGLKPYDIRNKFLRSMNDDPATSSNAYSTFRKAGMNDIDALIASKAVTDPSEVHKNNLAAQAEEINKQNSKTDKGDPNENLDNGGLK